MLKKKIWLIYFVENNPKFDSPIYRRVLIIWRVMNSEMNDETRMVEGTLVSMMSL